MLNLKKGKHTFIFFRHCVLMHCSVDELLNFMYNDVVIINSTLFHTFVLLIKANHSFSFKTLKLSVLVMRW